MAIANPKRLLATLLELPRETEWVEFKENYFDPEEVGRYVSGLANSAILSEEDRAYLVFGVDDATHEVVGTTVKLKERRVGTEIYEHWLSRLLNPRINVEFVSLKEGGKTVEMMVIDPAYISPVRFKSEAFIRVDSVQKRLSEYPERERAIWAITSRLTFEQGIAASHLSKEEVLDRFDCDTLLKGLGVNKATPASIIDHFLMEGFLVDDKQGGFDATNLLALLAAKDLREFHHLSKKAPRVIVYKGSNKLQGIDDVTGQLGYGISFSRLLSYIMARVPHREEMIHGVRHTKYNIPEIAVREIVANALIHQDLTSTGDGPKIEIFSDKLKVSNPGEPLINPERFIDAPAKSRNEKLAGLMRRLGYCEERGSGIDRALDEIEREALPAPLFAVVEKSMVVTLFRERVFADMTKDDRIRACYQHASLRFESGGSMSNGSLRKRFGLRDKQYPQVSSVIRDALDADLIRPLDKDQSNRNARYIPWWAADYVTGSRQQLSYDSIHDEVFD